MGTKVQGKSYLPGYHSMRDLNEDSNWPLYHGDKTLSNGQYCNGFLPRDIVDAYPEYDKDVMKRTMLEHEAIFKNQVYELHRLYRIQRNLMDETKRRELDKYRFPFETSLSSSPLASQNTSEDGRKSSIRGFPLSNSVSAKPSISGAEDMHSPFSPLKGNSSQSCSVPPSQNGTSSKSKDKEVPESRPTKVQRKMFDLELPASEYIDTEEGEQFRNDKSSSYLINGNHKTAPEGSAKLFLGDVWKSGRERDASSLRSSNGLADLNEPVQAEETNAPAYMGTSHWETLGGAKNESQFIGVHKEISVNSFHGSHNGAVKSFFMENNENGRIRFPHVLEAGQSRGYTKSAWQPIQARINEMPTFHNDQSKIDPWRERTACGLDSSERILHHPDSGMASHMPGHYLGVPREKPSSLGQMPIPFQSLSTSAALSKSSQSFALSHGVHGNVWDQPSVSRAISGFGREFPYRDGFYHGSSSGSKDAQAHLSSISHDYPNCNNAVSETFSTHDSLTHYNGSSCMERRPAKDVNLNVVLSTSSSHEAVDGERKQEEHCVGLPWLRSKLDKAADSRDSRKDELSFLSSSSYQRGNCSDVDGLQHKRIFGFSIVEKPCVFENECPPALPQLSETNSKCRLLDINLPCDAVSPEKGVDVEVSATRHHIDLNSCVSEDEASLIPFTPSNKAKTLIEIDLESLVAPEAEQPPDELAKMAAEAIVGISSFVDASMPDPLNWFAEIAFCHGHGNEIEFDVGLGGDNEESSKEEEVDYFESMTLKLAETKADEYLPKPLALEKEETGVLPIKSCPKRGRRGRQRKDFQRDILPGLTSLSRHEVREDLQALGGHSWQSRRSSGRNGRPRTVVDPPQIVAAIPALTRRVEVGLACKSLTGWGKTTRRPRRARCPPDNPQTIPLS